MTNDHSEGQNGNRKGKREKGKEAERKGKKRKGISWRQVIDVAGAEGLH